MCEIQSSEAARTAVDGAAGAGPRPGAVARLGAVPRLGAAMVAVLATAATLTALRAGIHIAHVAYNSPVAAGYGTLWSVAMLAVVAAGYLLRRLRHAAMWTSGLAGVAAGLASFPLLAGLHGTDQPLFGVFGGDNSFRTEYVTHLATGWGLHDYTFAGLPAFYPPGWFWVGGRWAAWSGMQPWQVMKPLFVLTPVVALLLAYALWRSVARPATALAAPVISMLVFSPGQLVWYEPYSALVAIAGVAWLAAAAAQIRRPAGGVLRPAGGLWPLIGLAVTGAALALCYYLLFVILIMALLALALLRRGERRLALTRAAMLLGGVAILTGEFWLPFLISLFLHGSPTQGRFFNPAFLDVTTGFTNGPTLAVVAGVGVVLLCVTIRSAVSQALAVLLAVTLLYQLVSVATEISIQQQLQPQRAAVLLYAALGAAVPIGMEALQQRAVSPPELSPDQRHMSVAMTAAVIAVLTVPSILVLATNQANETISGRFAVAAHHNAALSEAIRQTDEISAFITSTTGRRPQQLTVISAYRPLLILKPYYGFTQWNIHYANPESDTAQRIALLRKAAACPDAACFTRTLDAATRAPIDSAPVDAAVLNRTTSSDYEYAATVDGFPTAPKVEITFRARVFGSTHWLRRDIGPVTVFIRRR